MRVKKSSIGVLAQLSFLILVLGSHTQAQTDQPHTNMARITVATQHI